jgi:hypothetical protein
MADDSLFITRRLKLAAEASNDELDASDTIVLEDTDLMETGELKRLLDPAGRLTKAVNADLQDDESE